MTPPSLGASHFVDALAELERSLTWQSLDVDGYVWRWLDTGGPGPTALLLPGSVGDGGMFVSTLSALRSRARLVAVTYPALSEPERLADGLAHVMRHLDLASAVVVGSSFAAYWAQFFALRYPERVRALVVGNGLVDSHDLSYDPLFVPAYLESVSPNELHSAWMARVGNLAVSPLQQLQSWMLADRQTPENLHARFLGVGRAKVCPPLTVPISAITLLDCADDPLVPPTVRARLRSRYLGARHISLPTGGHYPHLLNPQAYQDLLHEVLSIAEAA
jgi:maspardin